MPEFSVVRFVLSDNGQYWELQDRFAIPPAPVEAGTPLGRAALKTLRDQVIPTYERTGQTVYQTVVHY